MPGSTALGSSPLPRHSPAIVRSEVVHSIPLASTALAGTWSPGISRRRRSVQLAARLDRAHSEVAMRKGELSINNSLWFRSAHRRPRGD